MNTNMFNSCLIYISLSESFSSTSWSRLSKKLRFPAGSFDIIGLRLPYLSDHIIPHSTVILKEYFENIPLKSCNIAKIFIKLLERLLKYCRNLAMSV